MVERFVVWIQCLNPLDIVLWTPVLESDQVKYKGCERSNAKKESIPLREPRIRG